MQLEYKILKTARVHSAMLKHPTEHEERGGGGGGGGGEERTGGGEGGGTVNRHTYGRWY